MAKVNDTVQDNVPIQRGHPLLGATNVSFRRRDGWR